MLQSSAVCYGSEIQSLQCFYTIRTIICSSYSLCFGRTAWCLENALYQIKWNAEKKTKCFATLTVVLSLYLSFSNQFAIQTLSKQQFTNRSLWAIRSSKSWLPEGTWLLPEIHSCPLRSHFCFSLEFQCLRMRHSSPMLTRGVNHTAPSKLSPVYERHLEKICIIY